MNPDIVEIINKPTDLYWGPVIAQYFFFTGISAAAFLISSLTYVFNQKRYEPIAGLALIVAFTVLAAAPLNLIADLAQPGRFYTLLYRTHITSPMSWGVFLLTSYPLLILLEGLFAFRAHFARRSQTAQGIVRALYTLAALGSSAVTEATQRRDRRISRWLGIIGIPMALAVHGYTGFILWFAAGRPLWNTPLMPAVFLVSALVSGLALMILLTWLMAPDADGKPRWPLMDSLALILSGVIAIDLALRALWHGLSYAADPQTYSSVLTFLFEVRFVDSVVVELGLTLLLPLLVFVIPRLRRMRALFLLAALLTFIGVFLFRWNTVIGGQEIPRYLAGYLHFVPTAEELMLVAANWGLWIFLMLVATTFIPWQETTEHTRADSSLPTAGSALQGGVSS